MSSASYQLSIIRYPLQFRFPAGTSRGVYTTRDVWYVTVFSHGRWGVGECAPLPNLSCDALPDYEKTLTRICREIEERKCLDVETLRPYPSILFGLETAFRHFETGSFKLWNTPFSRSEAGIPINGLIWMGDYAHMLKQVEDKIQAGFRCIKLKIGAIDFEEEWALLRHIRRHFTTADIELRVDANGAFTPVDALDKLNRLAELGIHSIEQPIRPGQQTDMARLVAQSPLPIALDEELIGHHCLEEKQRLLDAVRPQYIVLKPSLHGGFSGCREWIEEARRRHIGWWITSALESNIGLNAIAQWCATLHNPLPQGLGTGELFTNNIALPLQLSRLTSPPSLWWKGNPSFPWDNGADGEVVTSGSTGTPRRLKVKQEQMIASARQTCSFLELREGDKALLCMPLQYIGAKMMVARTIVAGLELTVCPPSGHPLKEIDTPFRFAAMLPLQVYNSLQTPIERERLMRIEILLIGGSAIDPELEKEIRNFPNAVYSTYGMTETLSHIALRRLNGEEASPYYRPFPSVELSLSEENTLIIYAPLVCDVPLITNDIAELLPDGYFRILGRKDNIINSGGIKLQTETLEEKLRPLMPVPFAISSVPHPQLGEAVVLLIEKGSYNLRLLQEEIASALPKYERPRYICPVEIIPLAGNGKIDRQVCKKLCLSQYKNSDCGRS
ncbi:MAG: AMP-binding protein [Tannerellaceae bacterium]|jgi:o-succinylbenzoate synthase|nr:AMP-binding protein [Tannerellaceae bacterium]